MFRDVMLPDGKYVIPVSELMSVTIPLSPYQSGVLTRSAAASYIRARPPD